MKWIEKVAVVLFFQAEDGIRDVAVTGSDVCSSDLDRSGGDIQKFAGVVQDFLGQANKRTELTRVFTQFNVRTPQIEYVLDRERAKTLGVSLSNRKRVE